VLLYGTLALCAAIIGWMVLRYDLYDREPWHTLALVMLVGAALMWLAGKAQGALIRLAADHTPNIVGNTLFATLAGTLEEIAKIASVLIVAFLFRRHFNDPIDGLIYGSFAGLGAAIEESIFHMGFESTTMILPGQEPIRLMGHLIMGGIGGFGLGFWFVRAPRWPLWTFGSLAAAILLHTLWDIVAFDAADHLAQYKSINTWHTAASIALMLAGMIAFRIMVVRGSAMSRSVFRPEPFATSPSTSNEPACPP
jgi:RsiW-degrading membrane proteinase PrsW (M82 family)